MILEPEVLDKLYREWRASRRKPDYTPSRWDEYSHSCRVDGGKFDLPWDALADDTYKDYITSLVEKQVEKQNAESAAEEARKLAHKRAQLAQLKAELGES